MSEGLLKSFYSALPPSVKAYFEPSQAAAEQLGQLVRQASEAWKKFELPPPYFAAFMAQRCAEPKEPLSVLQRLYLPDLYLACGCCAKLDPAIAILERNYLRNLPRSLSRLSLAPALIEEVIQVVREQLFVPNAPQKSSALERYLGRAPLRAWLRAVALRTAMRLLRARCNEVPMEDGFLEERLAVEKDIELSFLREAYRPAFRSAFAAALERLTTRQRNLLRQHYLDGLKVEQLAVMYAVHRVTLSRWLADARNALSAAVKTELVESLGLRPSECASVVKLCMSQPDLSLSAFAQ